MWTEFELNVVLALICKGQPIAPPMTGRLGVGPGAATRGDRLFTLHGGMPGQQQGRAGNADTPTALAAQTGPQVFGRGAGTEVNRSARNMSGPHGTAAIVNGVNSNVNINGNIGVNGTVPALSATAPFAPNPSLVYVPPQRTFASSVVKVAAAEAALELGEVRGDGEEEEWSGASGREVPDYVLDFATELNTALRRGAGSSSSSSGTRSSHDHFREDVSLEEVAALLRRIRRERHGALAFIARQPQRRVTRLQRMVFQRGLAFDGSLSEWIVGGRRQVEMERIFAAKKNRDEIEEGEYHSGTSGRFREDMAMLRNQ